MNRREIGEVLRSGGLTPRHRYGQNFMVDERVLAAIADAGEITADDVVLEVGPGVGNLTRLLAAHARTVLAVDIDEHLLAAATRHHANLANVVWMHADVLAGKHKVNPAVAAKIAELWAGRGKVRLVSNLPYNAASPLIAELLVMMWAENGALPFAVLAFTVQWEVAERMAAPPGNGDYGPLSVIVQALAEVEILRKIPPGAFWPPPKVNSALVRVRPDLAKMQRVGNALELQKLLAGVFGHRRQKLSNGLRHFLGPRWTEEKAERVRKLGIDLNIRPECLPVDGFIQLTAAMAD